MMRDVRCFWIKIALYWNQGQSHIAGELCEKETEAWRRPICDPALGRWRDTDPLDADLITGLGGNRM